MIRERNGMFPIEKKNKNKKNPITPPDCKFPKSYMLSKINKNIK